MKPWVIVAIGAAVALIGYFLLRKKVAAPPVVMAPTSLSTTPTVAPGVSPYSGTVPSNIPPPPRDGVATPSIPNQASRGSVAARIASVSPAGIMQHIPVIGSTAANLMRAPMNIGLAVGDKINSSLEHIPVAGKLLAAPGKVASSVLHSISSFF